MVFPIEGKKILFMVKTTDLSSGAAIVFTYDGAQLGYLIFFKSGLVL